MFVSGVKECSPVPAKACSKICVLILNLITISVNKISQPIVAPGIDAPESANSQEPLRWPAKQRLLRSLSPSLRLMTDEASKQRVNFCARRMVRGRWV